jgi:hypothetical protein
MVVSMQAGGGAEVVRDRALQLEIYVRVIAIE